MNSFRQFISEVETRKEELPEALVPVHQEIYSNVQAG